MYIARSVAYFQLVTVSKLGSIIMIASGLDPDFSRRSRRGVRKGFPEKTQNIVHFRTLVTYQVLSVVDYFLPFFQVRVLHYEGPFRNGVSSFHFTDYGAKLFAQLVLGVLDKCAITNMGLAL
jgi:hypothetical protein